MQTSMPRVLCESILGLVIEHDIYVKWKAGKWIPLSFLTINGKVEGAQPWDCGLKKTLHYFVVGPFIHQYPLGMGDAAKNHFNQWFHTQ